MAIASGTRLGPYEILSPLGAGGMGEVYHARDTRLGRDVAVKVLPSSFSADPDRLRRFEQEARAAGALNHPNILAIHDVGRQEGMPYVVSELLEGETCVIGWRSEHCRRQKTHDGRGEGHSHVRGQRSQGAVRDSQGGDLRRHFRRPAFPPQQSC